MTTAKERAQLAELAEVDRSNRVGRTVIQYGTPALLFTLLEWILGYFDADLDPRTDGVQDQFPLGVKEALTGLAVWTLARYMNRPITEPVGEPDAGAVTLLEALGIAALAVLILLVVF